MDEKQKRQLLAKVERLAATTKRLRAAQTAHQAAQDELLHFALTAFRRLLLEK